MDAERRAQIAAASGAVLPDVHQAVIDGLSELIPGSRDWRPDRAAHARAASRAVLEGLVIAFEQGDLDDRRWERVRRDIVGRGEVTPDEAAELLRAVRIIAVQLLTERLSSAIGLTEDERWHIQRDAWAFCQDALDIPREIDPAAFDEMLAELERAGPDLR
ncbi:MAG TPA: hypothetical protein VML96_07040 [Egibacteraceae bacterium]|nr:hypothetical protein [Egibacteraceae bacterium]